MEEILSTGKEKTIYNKTLEKISVTVQNNKIATGRIWKRFKKIKNKLVEFERREIR